jgi:hypothetical protein
MDKKNTHSHVTLQNTHSHVTLQTILGDSLSLIYFISTDLYFRWFTQRSTEIR